MTWVVCPKMEIPGTKIDISNCARCTETMCKGRDGAAEDIIKSWFQPAVEAGRAAKLLETKSRRKQMCPATTNLQYCYASKRLCRYNTVCADVNPAQEKTLIYTEKKMFLIKRIGNAKIEESTKTLKNLTADIKDMGQIEQVTETLLGVRVVHELLPVSEKTNKKSIPSELSKVTKLLHSSGAEITIEELLKKPLGDTAWVPATIYKPSTSLVVFKVAGAPSGKKRASRAKKNNDSTPIAGAGN